MMTSEKLIRDNMMKENQEQLENLVEKHNSNITKIEEMKEENVHILKAIERVQGRLEILNDLSNLDKAKDETAKQNEELQASEKTPANASDKDGIIMEKQPSKK